MVSNSVLRASDWFYYGEWQQPPFSAAFWVHWFDAGLCREMNFGELKGGFVMLDGHSIPSRSDFEALTKRGIQAVDEEDSEFMASISRVSQRVFGEALAFSRKLEGRRDLDEVALFEEFLRVEKRVMVPWLVTCVLSDVLGDELALRAEVLGVNAGEVVAALPQKESIMFKQRREALALKAALEKEGKTDALLKKTEAHVREFEWVGTHHFWGERFTVEKFFAELGELDDAPKKQGVIPEALAFVAAAANEAGFIRQYAAEVFDVVAYAARPLLTEIACKFGLTYDELIWLTFEETRALLRSRPAPEAALLKARLAERKRNGFCVYESGGKEFVESRAAALAAIYAELAPHAKRAAGAAAVRELRGRGACPGRARGAVKIFLVPENLEKMRDGDVLVAPMTTPDFVPIMKRAAAIVTDNGGLLSHAAIVSRELGIPCVVGTRSATKSFRDGEVVDVDGASGVVKKVY